jgi:glycosyltransferase involved in cell wall biosynthesis
VIPHGMPTLEAPASTGMRSVLLLPNDDVPTVGVLGAIGPVKGARRLERLVARTRERALKLRWVVIGYLDRQYQPFQDADKTLTIHGPYQAGDLPELIAHYRVRLTVFPSVGPETFSFTLSESWHAGCPALVPPMGALAERMQDTHAGWIADHWDDDDAVLDQIVRLLAPENAEMLAAAGERARSVPHLSLGEIAAATHTIYRSVKATPLLASVRPLPKHRLLNGLRTAYLTAAEEQRRRDRWIDRALLALAKLALRFRYTWAGRWAYHLVPQHVQRSLKRRLLA